MNRNWYEIGLSISLNSIPGSFTIVEWLEEGEVTEKILKTIKSRTRGLRKNSYKVSLMELYRLESDGTKTTLKEEISNISNLL